MIYAPFTPDQIKNIEEFQNAGIVHEMSCQNGHRLIASENGLFCGNCDSGNKLLSAPVQICVLDGIADGSILKDQRSLLADLGYNNNRWTIL